MTHSVTKDYYTKTLTYKDDDYEKITPYKDDNKNLKLRFSTIKRSKREQRNNNAYTSLGLHLKKLLKGNLSFDCRKRERYYSTYDNSLTLPKIKLLKNDIMDKSINRKLSELYHSKIDNLNKSPKNLNYLYSEEGEYIIGKSSFYKFTLTPQAMKYESEVFIY